MDGPLPDSEASDPQIPNRHLFDTNPEDVSALWATIRKVCSQHDDVLALRSMLSDGDVALEALLAHHVTAAAYGLGLIDVDDHFEKTLVTDFNHLQILAKVYIGPERVKKYLEALQHQPCEQELAASIEKLVARDIQCNVHVSWEVSKTRKYIGKYDEELWRQPPAWRQAEARSFRPPQVGFWATIQNSPDLLKLVEGSCFVAISENGTSRVTCPYLSIDYLEGDENKPTTGNLLFISVFILYNRFVLREKAFRAQDDDADIEVSDIRHYSLAFNRTKFQLWCLKPKVADEAGSVSYPSVTERPWWAHRPKKFNGRNSQNESNIRVEFSQPASPWGSVPEQNNISNTRAKSNGRKGISTQRTNSTDEISTVASLTSDSTAVSVENEPEKFEAERVGAKEEKPISAWRGCSASLILEGDSTSATNLNGLASWMNEVHRWGLIEHTRSVERDCQDLHEAAHRPKDCAKPGLRRAESESW